jgi:hypothetical protein
MYNPGTMQVVWAPFVASESSVCGLCVGVFFFLVFFSLTSHESFYS